MCVDRNLDTQLEASIFDGSSPDSRYERRFTVVSDFILEHKHATKKLSENVIQMGIKPGSPDYMLGALNHSAIESPTLATWRSQPADIIQQIQIYCELLS